MIFLLLFEERKRLERIDDFVQNICRRSFSLMDFGRVNIAVISYAQVDIAAKP